MSYEYFSSKELQCKCGCGKQEMNEAFMTKIVEGRRESSFPWTVTSAYRCPEYNKEVSFTGYDGPHTRGRAIDIKVNNSKQRAFIIDVFKRLGFTRIGIAKDFVHGDDLTWEDGFPTDVVWVYC